MRMLPGCILSLLLACCSLAIAGPPFPCVRAASSKNGNFLVLPEPYFPGQQRVSLQIFSKEIFINEHQRLSAPATYWAGQSWSIVLDAGNMHNAPAPCPLPLITDDGEFLILVHVGAAYSGAAPVLQIYRKRHPGDPLGEGQDRGLFIGEIPLNKIWAPDRVAAVAGIWTDHSPEWFSGGTFEFSSDNRQLIHKTRWGNTVRINLANASTSDK